MSGQTERARTDRLLTFEVGGRVCALPIDGVLEVAERSVIRAVPTLDRRKSAVMNWHGDALPLVAPQLLIEPESTPSGTGATPLEGDEAEGSSLETEHVLVVADRRDEIPRLGLPIDGVLGIVEGRPRAPRASSDVVVERRPIDGRIVSVLDPRRLMERAREVIEGLVD